MTDNPMDEINEFAIISSWKKNVDPWIRAINNQEIESRNVATNKAIMDVILELSPKSLLDIGCGEGWLVRELESKGIESVGVDAIPEFIEVAEREGTGQFHLLTYEELSIAKISRKFDILVCNFSLFGKESVLKVFQSAIELLNIGGSFVIQTLHPFRVKKEERKVDGWKEGSWFGFNSEFQDPAPWYYRTTESWKSLFSRTGFEISEIVEVVNPKSGLPTSMIFVGMLKS